MMLRWFAGLLWALAPLVPVIIFYDQAYVFYPGSDSYVTGQMILVFALLSCIIFPVTAGVWFFERIEPFTSVCFVASILVSASCVTVLYLDPGHQIYALMAG